MAPTVLAAASSRAILLLLRLPFRRPPILSPCSPTYFLYFLYFLYFPKNRASLSPMLSQRTASANRTVRDRVFLRRALTAAAGAGRSLSRRRYVASRSAPI